MVSGILLGVSVLVFVSGVIGGMVTFSWVKDARSVEGTVIELVEKKSSSKEGKSTTYAPKVSYLIDGEKREFVSSQSSSSAAFKVGESVRVAANLRRDKECIATFGELYGFAVGAIMLGLAMGLTTAAIVNGDRILRWMHPNLS